MTMAYGDDYIDHFSNEKYEAHRTNVEQARALGFRDLSPRNSWGTDCGEHVAVCQQCFAMVHYPLTDTSQTWPPRTEYVKGTDTLRAHLQSVHGASAEEDDHGVHRGDPAQR
ncbi:hypothetical protein SEA_PHRAPPUCCINO_116 [Mycobacterium phage Phrappuccino]|uniref:Uncharacterized protein n=1 Tax=Mycobacterium phage Phrappuccino TaxID=2591223 RepID=A0A514DDV1_9CAUD|nr:hypothetical protein KHQ87_gp116 [Mycobacterium phage Phrappuccino]QDH91791.1 hypothetical protein SEA_PHRAPPUCCINO_116 [Mycobacterium phage Phrappuccino]QIQ63233.1 hypothetical protein SEA_SETTECANDELA_116 [Mycobacterium phage Settecandela]